MTSPGQRIGFHWRKRCLISSLFESSSRAIPKADVKESVRLRVRRKNLTGLVSDLTRARLACKAERDCNRFLGRVEKRPWVNGADYIIQRGVYHDETTFPRSLWRQSTCIRAPDDVNHEHASFLHRLHHKRTATGTKLQNEKIRGTSRSMDYSKRGCVLNCRWGLILIIRDCSGMFVVLN